MSLSSMFTAATDCQKLVKSICHSLRSKAMSSNYSVIFSSLRYKTETFEKLEPVCVFCLLNIEAISKIVV